METAGLEVKYIYVDKEFIIEAIIFCLKNGLWFIFSLLTFILIWKILIFRKNKGNSAVCFLL